jgi:hypothetical protein
MKKSMQITYAVLIAVVLVLVYFKMFRGRSSYVLGQPMGSSDLIITSNGVDPSEMVSLPHKLECVPGPQETASPYTKSLTPGGYCGIQEFVKSQADYVITGGIGESLLA